MMYIECESRVENIMIIKNIKKRVVEIKLTRQNQHEGVAHVFTESWNKASLDGTDGTIDIS